MPDASLATQPDDQRQRGEQRAAGSEPNVAALPHRGRRRRAARRCRVESRQCGAEPSETNPRRSFEASAVGRDAAGAFRITAHAAASASGNSASDLTPSRSSTSERRWNRRSSACCATRRSPSTEAPWPMTMRPAMGPLSQPHALSLFPSRMVTRPGPLGSREARAASGHAGFVLKDRSSTRCKRVSSAVDAGTVDPQFADVMILVATTEHMSDVRVALAESDRAREPTLGG